MSLPVRTTPEADSQIRVIDDWWRKNRTASPVCSRTNSQLHSNSSAMHHWASVSAKPGTGYAPCSTQGDVYYVPPQGPGKSSCGVARSASSWPPASPDLGGPSVMTQYAMVSGAASNRSAAPTKPAPENKAGRVLPNQLPTTHQLAQACPRYGLEYFGGVPFCARTL